MKVVKGRGIVGAVRPRCYVCVVAIEREDAPAFRGSHYSEEDLSLLRQGHEALGGERG